MNANDELPPMPGSVAEKKNLPPMVGSAPSVQTADGDYPIIVDVEGTRACLTAPDALALAGRIIATVECWERYSNGR
jgi:hypothetical protein